MTLTWRDKLIEFEIGNRAYYEKYASNPVWPGGFSGVTIGVGYDLGQHTEDQFTEDWCDYPSLIPQLIYVCGIRGEAAHRALASVARTYIPYDAAVRVFNDIMLPHYMEMTAKVFPNSDKLPPEAFGALVDLVFNRGASVDPKDDRRREMLAIQRAMAAGHFDLIPGTIRAMRRLWPFSQGLQRRREWEASTFERALGNPILPMSLPVLPVKPARPTVPFVHRELTSDELNERELERIRKQNYGQGVPLGDRSDSAQLHSDDAVRMHDRADRTDQSPTDRG